MSAQETTISILQQQLHAENQRRFVAIEEEQQKQRALLESIARNTADLPKLKEDVESLTTDRNKFKGATRLAVLMGGGGLVSEGVRWLFFRH